MKSLLIALALLCTYSINAQNLADECKLKQGINLAGLADYGMELAFVDRMKNAREWYTKDNGNPADPFNSEQANNLTYRADGYPTHVPQTVEGHPYPQRVVTIWAETDAWVAGEYTVLWEGTGELSWIGGFENMTVTDPHRLTFDFPNPVGNVLEMTIVESDINDPIRNIRVLMPGTEATYQTQPFNQTWLNLLGDFPSVRFMDWGQTNNWGHTEENAYTADLFDWSDRSQMEHYTWAYNKGVPYEMMVLLMNELDIDGWVCVPHRASDDYIQNMAAYFRDNLEAERKLTVEYSNEIWNFLFQHTQWLNTYAGCTNATWPSCKMSYVQNCLDIWTTTFAGQTDRIRRVAGTMLGNSYVGNEMLSALTPGSFDAIAPTFYFDFTETGKDQLDALGASATVADLRPLAREGLQESKVWLTDEKENVADAHNVEMTFYEGGQHLVGTFGETPDWAQALVDFQRDSAMYNLYNELFDHIRTLQEGTQPMELMNFSFIAKRSAQYGSWGILENMAQDFSMIPAPKYVSVLENGNDCNTVEEEDEPIDNPPAPTVTNVRNFIFGHSLVDFTADENMTPMDGNRIPHWIHVIAEEAGYDYQATGQFGFLPQHANLPPSSNWGFEEMPNAVWDSEVQDFSEANFNTVLLTAGNFMQWQSADAPYPTEDGILSPLTATIDIMDWTVERGDNMRIYIYENWPDMAPFLTNQIFPPSSPSEFANYNNYIAGDFHTWWLDYQDMALVARPDIYPRMIPVGPIIAELLTETPLSALTATDLYVDDAPHGTPTVYFLAGLITYMGMYAEAAPDSYVIPEVVHPLVATHYETTVDYIWNYLLNFNDENGNSRVFFESAALPVELVDFKGEKFEKSIDLTWTTRNEANNNHFEIEYSTDNQTFINVGRVEAQGENEAENYYDFAHEDYRTGVNYYRLKQVDKDGHFVYSEVVNIAIPTKKNQVIVFPNPSPDGHLQVAFNAGYNAKVTIEIYDVAGRKVHDVNKNAELGMNEYQLNLQFLERGMYILQAEQGDFLFVEKVVLY